ncbi:MAG TPA: hypothetical protein VMM93_06360 [Vicinamibacterales bacterium]|nr:hypothetical protein [Vicinamibacterales bacterium]
MLRRVTAACALMTFVGALLLPSVTVTHAWNDADLTGGESIRLAGHVDTALGSPTGRGTADHCALCHWLRNLGSSAVSGSVRVTESSTVRVGADATTLSLIAVYGEGCPARAPPAIRPV